MKIEHLSILVSCLALVGFPALDAFSESDTTVPYSVHPINDTAFAVTGVINKTIENALVTLEIKNNANNSPIFVAQTIPVEGGNFTFIVPNTGPLWQNVKNYSVIVNYENPSASQNSLLASSDTPHGVFLDIIKVPNSLQFPLKQLQQGIKAQDVKCNSNLQLIFKYDDKSPVCVKPTTASILIERGWAMEKIDPLLTNMKVRVYGSYGPGTLLGHFLKGSLDSIVGPISNGTVSVTVNDIFMGNTVTDPQGCFQFNSWNDTKLSAQINQSRTNMEQKGVLDALDLKIVTNYLGDHNHHAANATVLSSLNLWALPLPPPSYQMYTSPSLLNVTQGNSIHFELTVKPFTAYSQVNKMILSVDRIPCGVTSTISHNEGADKVSLDHPGIFDITLNTSSYTPTGTYWIMITQDTSGLSNSSIDPDITMLPIKVISKDSQMR